MLMSHMQFIFHGPSFLASSICISKEGKERTAAVPLLSDDLKTYLQLERVLVFWFGKS